ncbi:hypothetical protein chiPu_0015169 [Chiloscyllium punctatum]|uniref:Uncharacterized protein n=1 Tax=Chiloscyllium punctatum TaxID=137246 RepID=A0A401T1Z3_CHIPU|nr:hypothetical protein [Chiloscyllium punctatum]
MLADPCTVQTGAERERDWKIGSAQTSHSACSKACRSPEEKKPLEASDSESVTEQRGKLYWENNSAMLERR